MRHMTLLGFVLLLGITGPLTPLHAWDSRRDNKAIAELQLMNENELLHEAMETCAGGTGARNVSDAYDYLDTIGRIARTQNKSSDMPWWINDMHEAVRVGNAGLCVTIWSQAREQQRPKADYRKGQANP